MTGTDRRTLIAVLGFLMFAAVYVQGVVTPVLIQVAGEFGISTGTAGLVAASYAAPGIVIAVVAGPYSDRLGRKAFLVVGSLLMGAFTVLGSVAPTFPILVATRALAGSGAALIFPNVNATIGDTFPYRERGKVISAVIAMNTMASVIGIPVAGIVAEATSWRVSLLIVGVLGLLATGLLAARLRAPKPAIDERRTRAFYRAILESRSAIAAIASSLLGSLYWFTWVTYLVVFFERLYALSQGAASTLALTTGLGVLIGSQVGGRLGDRVGHKRIVGGGILISAALLLVQTNLALPLEVVAVTNLLLSTVIGARFAANSVLLTEQVPEARGTLLAISAAVTSASMVAGATIGGVLVDGIGFWALGVFCAAAAALGAFIVLTFVTEEPIDLEITA